MEYGMAVEMDEDAGLLPPPARTQGPVIVRAAGWITGARTITRRFCVPFERYPRRAMEDGMPVEMEDTVRLLQPARTQRSRPVSLSVAAGAGASQDPTIWCAVRAESTSNIGSRDANREGGQTVLVRPPKAPSLSVPGYRIANANQYHSTLCTVRANSTSNNGKWGGRREGGWRSRWWTKDRCRHEPARPRGGCWVWWRDGWRGQESGSDNVVCHPRGLVVTTTSFRPQVVWWRKRRRWWSWRRRWGDSFVITREYGGGGGCGGCGGCGGDSVGDGGGGGSGEKKETLPSG